MRTSERLSRSLRRSAVILFVWTVIRILPAAAQSPPPGLHFDHAFSGSNGRQGIFVRIGLSQPVDLAELKAHLEVTPAVPKLEILPQGDGRFTLHGDWLPTTRYEIRITPGLKTKAGATLSEPISNNVKTQAIRPYLAFDLEGKFYLPRQGGLDLAIESRKIDDAELKLSRMFPSNLAAALDQIAQNGNVYTGFDDKWCEEVGKWKLELGGGDQLKKTPADVMGRLKKQMRGVYVLQVDGNYNRANRRPQGMEGEGEGEGDYYYDYSYQMRDGRILILTNLGAVAHWRDSELILFVQDLYSVKPVWGARVTIWSTRNQMMGEGRTGQQGVVIFKEFKPNLGKPRVAVIEHDGDYTFLELTPRAEDRPLENVSLSPYDPKGYDAFLYADRELYRPGETVHLRWLVRKNMGDAAVKVPLMLSVLKPNGKTLVSQPTTLSELGAGGLDLPTQRVYPTGAYTARILMPGDEKKVLGSYTFYLEEFVPNRMKATVEAAQDRWVAGQPYEFTVNAMHLFGAPATGRKCEPTLSMEKTDFRSEKWKQYRFGNDTKFTLIRESLGNVLTDKDGNARFTYTWKPAASITFPLKGTLTARVFEPGGRAVSGRKALTLFPSNVCLGISAIPAEKPGQIVVSAAAINVDETPAKLDQVKVTLEKQIWNYNVRRYYSSLETDWGWTYESLDTKDLTLKDGRGEVAFLVVGYGYFRMRVHSEATPQFSTVDFVTYDGECHVMDASRPSLIKVAPEKDQYEAGETAQVRIESPFNGRALVVVQGENFKETFVTEIKNNIGRVRFKVRPEYFPCVWVEATVVHSILKKPMLVSPFSSFAMAPVKVTDRARKLDVSFPSLPKEIRPARELDVQVKVLDGAGKPARECELTLAAVDEGIHLTTGYQSPDPYGWLSRMRRPDLRRAHYYDKVAYDFEKPEPGGDMEGGMGKRLGEPSENWIKTVALWSGPVRPDKRGVANVKLNIPEFTGQVRLVAVAYDSKALGSKSDQLLIRRPWMLQTSQPRFLLPGDEFRAQAVLYNHSDAACTARVSWSTSGTLVGAQGQREVPIAAKGEASLAADLKAGEAMGTGRLTWQVEFVDANGQRIEQLREELPIPVKAPAAFASENQILMLKPGESRELRNTVMIENQMTELDLTVGASMMLRLQEALAYVIDYPYGCVEQTTSRLMPLYLLRQSTPIVMTVKDKTQRDLDEMIMAGIDRLFSMQTGSGGLGFWPGATHPYDYGSIYALHALTLIKIDRQIEVPADNYKALQRYVREILNDWSRDNMPDLFTRAYSVYALSLGGELDALYQIKRFDHVQLPRAARFLLGAALARNTRDPERVREYLETAPVVPWEVREQAGTLNSDIRNAALELMALREMGTAAPDDLARRANELISYLERNHHGTTQETAIIITALSGYLADVSKNIDASMVTITDPEGKENQLRGGNVYVGHAGGPGRVFRINNTGPNEIIVNFTTRGIPLNPDMGAVSKGLSVARTTLNQAGVTTGSTTFRQTDNMIVRLEIRNLERVALKNVVLTDILPAGFEIENPRLDSDAIPAGGIKNTIHPSYLEIRDDRLVLAFDEVPWDKPHYYHYLVRAVTPGRFQQPAVEAECMYDPNIQARTAMGRIEIQPVASEAK